MKLPASLGWLLFFVSLLAHICCEDVFGILGENFTFPVKIDKKIVEIIWTKNKDKVAEWEGLNEPTYFTSLLNRGLLNKKNGCLTIFNLENNDTGTYMLDYWDSLQKTNVLTFKLAVLPPPSEPAISCNVSGDDLTLKCTADFPKPLNYTWKFSSTPITYQTQEVFIPKNNVDASEKAACIIKFSQTEKGSEISLTQCFPDTKGNSYHKRSRVGLIVALVLSFLVVGTVGLLCSRGELQLLSSVDSQEPPNSDGTTSLQAIDYENKEPEAELSTKQNSTLMSKCAVDHDVMEGDIFKEENSSLLAKHADNHGINKGEETQDGEAGNGEHLSNTHSCSKEDLKS